MRLPIWEGTAPSRIVDVDKKPCVTIFKQKLLHIYRLYTARTGLQTF